MWKSLSHVRFFETPWTIQPIELARILEWVDLPFSRGSSQPRDRIQVSCIAGGFFTSWATRGDSLVAPSCGQCPWHCDRPRSTHVSARDSWTLSGKSGSVSCGVTAPFSWVLVHTRFCLCPPRVSVSLVLCKFCNQIPLAFKVKFLGDSVSVPNPQVGKSVVEPRTFAVMRELLWYNCSPVCLLPTQWLFPDCGWC